MWLMFKDIPIMWMNDSTNGMITITNEELLPLQLVKKIQTVDITKQNQNEVIKLCISNFTAIVSWLSSRVLSLSRKHAKHILNAYHFTQSQNEYDKAKISIVCRAVSILDCYWLKGDTEEIQWNNVDVKSIKFTDMMFHVALKGTSLTIQNKEYLTPEIGTFGAYAKGWRRDADGLFLYKAGERGSKEAQMEACASDILDCTDVRHLKYERVYMDKILYTRCRCLSSEEYSIINAGDVEAYCKRVGINFNQMILYQYSMDFCHMCQVDYLLSNSDRHSQNWGFWINNKTMKLECLHPLFDHNNAFDESIRDDTDYIAWSGKSMLESARYGANKFPIRIVKPIDKKLFPTKLSYEVFVERLDKLRITYKRKGRYIYP